MNLPDTNWRTLWSAENGFPSAAESMTSAPMPMAAVENPAHAAKWAVTSDALFY